MPTLKIKNTNAPIKLGGFREGIFYRAERKIQRFIINELEERINHLQISEQEKQIVRREIYKELKKIQLDKYYLSGKQQLQQYKLDLQNNSQFIDGEKKVISGRYIYVVSELGNIFAAPEGKVKHHSFLANGKKVKAAGFLEFENGKLTQVDNNSGHYRPNTFQMKDFLVALSKSISNRKDAVFVDYSTGETHTRISSLNNINQLFNNEKNARKNSRPGEKIKKSSPRQEIFTRWVKKWKEINKNFDKIVNEILLDSSVNLKSKTELFKKNEKEVGFVCNKEIEQQQVEKIYKGEGYKKEGHVYDEGNEQESGHCYDEKYEMGDGHVYDGGNEKESGHCYDEEYEIGEGHVYDKGEEHELVTRYDEEKEQKLGRGYPKDYDGKSISEKNISDLNSFKRGLLSLKGEKVDNSTLRPT